tara:strand:+ start:14197 stop:14409 length:213 start_codon:yes stop_codon:yes gene_type:complete
MKTMSDFTAIIIAISTALVGSFWWVINNILTNKSKVTLLEQKTDMIIELMKEMRGDQKEMRRDIHQLMKK